jgi:hypothetical protein
VVTKQKDQMPSSGCLVRNNLAEDLALDDGVSADHNVVLPANAAGFFADAGRHDLRLAAGSPAIDQGSADQAPAVDADGVPRPHGDAVDVGAFEYAPGAPRPEGGAGPGGAGPGGAGPGGAGPGGAGPGSGPGTARRRPAPAGAGRVAAKPPSRSPLRRARSGG